MNAGAGSLRGERSTGRRSASAEHRFYTSFTILLAAALVLGFARTFFLRPWYPEWTQVHAPPEPYFLFHGFTFALWFAVLLAQPALVASGRLDLHRRLGTFGGALAAVMVVVGTIGALIAARRPSGFVDVPVPPLQFLVVPLAGLALFASLVALGILRRRDGQSHKRLMLLASISLLGASIARWPFDIVTAQLPIPWLSVGNIFQDAFLVPVVIWDLASRGRLHPVTLWGGLALIAEEPLATVFAHTQAWLAFAGWAVSLLG